MKLKSEKLVPVLLKLTKNEDEYTVSRAVEALGGLILEDKRVYPVIESFVMDALTGDENTYSIAFFEAKSALIQSGAKAKACFLEISKILANAKVNEKGEYPDRIRSAIELVRKAGPHGKAAWPDLTKFLKAKKPELALETAFAIWTLKKDSRELQRVTSMIVKSKLSYLYFDMSLICEEMGQDAKVLLPQIQALVKIPGTAFPALSLIGALKSKDKETLKVVRAALQNSHPMIQIHAAETLWTISGESKEALTTLKDLLKHPKKNIQASAIFAIARLGDIGTLVQSQLLKHLRGPVLRRRLAVCKVLSQSQFKNDTVIKALKSASEDRDPEVAEAAMKALNELQKPGE